MVSIKIITKYHVQVMGHNFIIEFDGTKKELDKVLRDYLKGEEDVEFRPVKFRLYARKQGYYLGIVG